MIEKKNGYIQLPPLPEDLDRSLVHVLWEYAKLPETERTATFVASTALAMRVASTYLLKGIPQFGYHMIWWNTAFGWRLGFIVTWTHYIRGKWYKVRKNSSHSY